MIVQSSIAAKYEELVQLSSSRQHRLTETKDLHEFNRECDEVTKWIKEKEVVACSEDTGRDLEHVEVWNCCQINYVLKCYCCVRYFKKGLQILEEI